MFCLDADQQFALCYVEIMSTGIFLFGNSRRTTMKKVYFWLFIFLTLSSQVAAQTPYYQGKTIRMLVGTRQAAPMTCGPGWWLPS